MKGEPDEARKLLEGMIERERGVFGEDDYRTLMTRNALATSLLDQGRLDEASSILEDVLAKARRALGDSHAITLGVLGNLGGLRLAQGRLDDAVECRSQIVDILRRTKGEDSWETLDARCELAILRQGQGRAEEAESIFRDVVERSREATFASQWDHVWYEKVRYGGFLAKVPGRREEAERQVREMLKDALGESDPRTTAVVRALAGLYADWSRPEEAARWQEKLAPAR